MPKWGRRLLGLLCLVFLGGITFLAWRLDPDFWRSNAGLFRLTHEAANRGDYPRALELARKAYARDPQATVLLGGIHLKLGQPRETLEICRPLLAREPYHRAAVKLNAQALVVLGDRRQALETLQAYLQDRPDDPEMLQAAAEIAGAAPEDHPQAVIYYQRLYELSRDPAARRRLVDLLASLHRYEEAITWQEEEAGQIPHQPDALHRLALLYYWKRDYQAASRIYQQLLEKAAEDVALRREAAQTADAAQEVDRALTHYLWLYGRQRDNREYALALARLWSRKGRHAEAAGVLASLMEDKPTLEWRRWYAMELLLTGDFAKSLKAYEAAWQEGDTHKETLVNLARLHAQKSHFAKAAAFWDEAARRQLLDTELRWEAALTYSYAKRFPEALEVLQPLRRGEPQDPRLLLLSGQLHFYQKHWGQAAHFFKGYLEQRPRDAEVRRLLAEALSFGPETKTAALEQYGEALKLKEDPRLRLRRAHLLLEDRRWEEAARELESCPAAGEAPLLREQARLRLRLGDLEEALRHYELFLQHAPQDQTGRLEKARVLTYLGRIPEAMDLLNRLRLELPQDQGVRAAAIEAYISARDYAKALSLARKELEPLPDLGLEERALVARCYAHSPDPEHLSRAVNLVIDNLRENRHHHPSLLILASLLPRLPRFEDLSQVAGRIPGIRTKSPEYVAALAYFDGQLGRHGGKLNYLLHVLEEYRGHKWPDNPGELVGLGWLAMELGDRHAAQGYYRRALNLRPKDQNLARLHLKCQLAQKQWGQALVTLEQQDKNPANALEMARLYLIRGQYEGVKATVAQIPPDHRDYGQATLLLAQVYRREGNYAGALKTLEALGGKLPSEELLMEKARVLEAAGDKTATAVYGEIIRSQPESQAARIARARQARSRGDWSVAYKAYAAALKEAPQDIELLNELEFIRQQMRPQVASRGFPQVRGQRRPEEGLRPWQFSRFDREQAGRGLGLSNYFPALLWEVLPVVQPESLYVEDSNKLRGAIFRVSGAFWITKVLPASVSVEYRQYRQSTVNPGHFVSPNVRVLSDDVKTRLQRGEVSLGAGPLSVTDRLRISGEIIARRYWKRTDHDQVILNTIDPFFPRIFSSDFAQKEDRNRVFGSLEMKYQVKPKTELSLKYSRRDIYDQEAHLYPRLYQGVLNLEKARFTSLQLGEFSHNHQFRPGLDWRGNLGYAWYSDDNRRATLYQGLAWQALGQPRMGLEFSPHVYWAGYSHRNPAYFSPSSYLAMGLGVDFHRQLFRLPTLILQGTVQGVNQHGQWGPALQGLAALEWEWVHNFYTDLHVFYFREWVDNYYLFSAGVSFRWRF